MRYVLLLCLLVSTGLFTAARSAQPIDEDQPVELGLVHWNRNLADAKKKSAALGKPIFVLFQEVPG